MKKIFSFLTVLLFAGSMMGGSYTITFKDSGADGDSNSGMTSTTIADYVASGDSYVSAIAAEGKVYLAAKDYGLKFGNSSNPGKLTLTLAKAVKPTTIVMNASQYGDKEGSGLLQDSVFDMTGAGGKGKFKDYTYYYDGKTEVTTIEVGTKSKRGYVKSVTVNFADEEEEGPTYTVAGSNADVFGEAWDPEYAANDMKKQEDGSYKWEKTGLELAAGALEFKVCKDHSWAVAYPSENYELAYAESGVYTITITYEPENENKVSAVATKTADLVVLPKVVLHGNFTGTWLDTEEFVVAEDKKTASLELTLAEGTFNFGFKFDGSWKANGATIEREHNTTSLAEGTGDMSIVADEAGKYIFVYTFETQAVEVTFPAKRVTSDAVYALADNAEVALKDVTVTYSSGANVWVKDAKGALLIYLPSGVENTFKAGDVLAGVAGSKATYKGLVELKPSAAQVAAIVASPGEAPAPEELTAIDADKDMSKLVLLKNVEADGAFAEGSASNIIITLGENTYTLRNNFKNAFTFEAGKKYAVTAIVTYFNALQLYFITGEEIIVPADRRINAWGLNVVSNGANYTFSYNANIDGNEANLIFYENGEKVGEIELDAPKKGANEAVVAKEELPAGKLTWAVELKANHVTEFTKLAEGANLMKCHLAIDNSPESDFFGRMYIANRADKAVGGIYVYNQDYTLHTENTLAGQPKWQSMGRPSVAEDGTVYIGDWGDAHGGVYVMDPATLTATCLFDGVQDGNTGLWTNNGVALGSSTASVGVYGSGASTVLYAMNEDVSQAGTNLHKHGVNVYQLGQEDGSVLSTWTSAPTLTFGLRDSSAQMFVINATSKGAFFSCNRSKGNNLEGARSLQFYNTKGERTFVALPEGATADLTGSLGGGCAVSRDEKTLAIVDGDGNILVYAVEWAEDVPSLTKITKYETTFAALGSLCFDYAGNIVVTAGANYTNATPNKLVAYGVPTEKNEIIVPAKSSLKVSSVGTALEDNFVPVKVEKVIRGGQVLIIKDGKTYNMMGQIVK